MGVQWPDLRLNPTRRAVCQDVKIKSSPKSPKVAQNVTITFTSQRCFKIGPKSC